MWGKFKKSGLLKTESLPKKVMLSLCLGACFFAVQNPLLAAEPIEINSGTFDEYTQICGGYTTTVNAEKNLVTINGGSFGYMSEVYGGYSENANVKNNSVAISGGEFDANTRVVAGLAAAGAASDNKLEFSGGKLKGEIYGAVSGTGDAVNNSITVSDGELGAMVTGGAALDGDAVNNSVTISGGNFIIQSEVYGGYVEAGEARENIVNITGGSFINNAKIYAALAYNDADARDNTVNISDGTLSADVCGGYVECGDADGNKVNFTGGTLIGAVYGGLSWNEDGNSLNNTVTLKAGDITGKVFGGFSYYGDASNNVVVVDGAELVVEGAVFGGFNQFGAANGNVVKVSGGTIYGDAMGAYTIYGEASGNVVSISGGTIAEDILGGGSIYGKGNGNTANISGGTIAGNVYGGIGQFGDSGGNTVNISEGTFYGDVIGAVAGVEAGGNTVNISGGTFYGDVIGAVADGEASGNTVNISGGTIAGAIYGAQADGEASGNVLNVKGLAIKAGNICCFDEINFFVPNSVTNGSTMLNLTAAEDTDLSGTAVAGFATLEGDSQLKPGDTIYLIKKDGGELLTTNADGTEKTFGKLQATEGVSADYEFAILKQDDNLVATMNKAERAALKPQTKSLVETQTAGVAMLNSGMDMLAGEGIANAVAAAADNGSAAGKGAPGRAKVDTSGSEFAMFGMLGASNMKYKTGSHVDMDGWNLGLGFAKTVENNAGKLTFGPVISYGKGSYDSYLDNGTHGEGDSDYFGIGLFLHQANNDGLYYEGSVSGGRVSNDYSSNDLVTAAGAKAYEKYDTASNFVAAHLGLGKVVDVSDKAKLDVYGKYFYARQVGDDAKLTTGETYHFDSVDSNRIRIGARYEMEAGKAAENGKALSTVYVGTAYEYEFSGDARATYKGMETPSPSLKGSSGMLELGWKGTPSAGNPLTIDLSTNGWFGKKEGVGLKANFLWSF